MLLNSQTLRGVLNTGGTILGTSNISDPFEQLQAPSSKKKTPDKASIIIQNIKKLKLDAVITIGGDGTLTIANKLYQMGCPV
ncbi:MAG: 6-phosphofructokinase, partial [Candidatus Aminicenantes bacterium]|nr:6-phosphofructokinase [Candidatus Aminicenantes bacterium]NIN42576.1 6-phosphofructokinase [Candidatus Aminicenantes bacterium]NIN85342.1 6-phosphofructokinase [Candidatus Aminicenantes bacterium]NIR06116.1 6-phosphofructokinase [Candidatus Aminicenantes bacterium]NIT23461.1 6-phosphofructokinase [Candidatus Aminicenantes bacterium]